MELPALISLFGALRVPSNLTPDSLGKVLSTMGINIPALRISEVFTLVDAKTKAKRDITVQELLEDADINRVVSEIKSERGIISCPGCGFVQSVLLAAPDPCGRCGAARTSE